MSDLKILPSGEIRWFFKDRPTRLEAWFQATFPNVQSEGLREDYYLSFPGIAFAGVKLRPYTSAPPTLNLEFKLRDHDHGEVTLAPGVVGRMESWRKWTTAVNMNADAYKSAVTGSGKEWSFVRKDRRIVRFIVQDRDVELMEEFKEINQGCGLELTELTTGTCGKYWTFGFEAFSTIEGADVTMVLRHAATHVFKESAPSLPTENSFSYPYWLSHKGKENMRADTGRTSVPQCLPI